MVGHATYGTGASGLLAAALTGRDEITATRTVANAGWRLGSRLVVGCLALRAVSPCKRDSRASASGGRSWRHVQIAQNRTRRAMCSRAHSVQRHGPDRSCSGGNRGDEPQPLGSRSPHTRTTRSCQDPTPSPSRTGGRTPLSGLGAHHRRRTGGSLLLPPTRLGSGRRSWGFCSRCQTGCRGLRT